MISLLGPWIAAVAAVVVGLVLVVLGHIRVSRGGSRAVWITLLVIGYLLLIAGIVFGVSLAILGETIIPLANDIGG